MAIEFTGLPTTQVNDGNRNKEVTPLNEQQKQNIEAKPSNSPSSSDAVTLTDSAVKMQALEQSIARLPVVDQERVNSIKNAIESGQYKIDPESTANKFLEMEKTLFK